MTSAPAYPDFDPDWYLEAYPDVASSGMSAETHFRQYGAAEGRLGLEPKAQRQDNDLWRGLADMALPALEDLLNDRNPAYSAEAHWALARWYAAAENWNACEALLARLEHLSEGRAALPEMGIGLLGIASALHTGNRLSATQRADRLFERYGNSNDLRLARMALAVVENHAIRAVHGWLSGLYVSAGLGPIRLQEGDLPLLDRLHGVTHPADKPAGPLISVLMPAFNAQATIGTALRSLTAQTWTSLDIIVIDDGSTDRTAAIVNGFIREDSRIRLVRQKQQGAYVARNTGLSLATGTLITVHDADDWSHPAKLALQAAPLIAQPGLTATASHWARVTPDLMPVSGRMENSWIHRNVSSLMFRRSLRENQSLRENLGYWDRVRAGADTEFYYRILAAFGADAIHEVLPGLPLSLGRHDAGSLTRHSATHLRTQYGGMRRDYHLASRHWHTQTETLYVPRLPHIRPFPAPAKMALDEQPVADSPRDIIRASALYDEDWYIRRYPDTRHSDFDPAAHYLNCGAAEGRDPGPLFSSSAYSYAHGLADENPLLHWETQGRDAGAPPLPGFTGALADMPGRRIMMFAHACGPHIFGAERSLLEVLDIMRSEGDVPIIVLPEMHNPAYLQELQKRAAAVEILPAAWWHAQRPEHPGTIAAQQALIRRYAPAEVHVNTLVLHSPLIAARAEGVSTAVHVRELLSEDPLLCRAIGLSPQDARMQLLAIADRLFVTSRVMADWLDATERTTLRRNRVDPALFDLPVKPVRPLRVAMVSSNTLKKGLGDFLDVARRVAAAGSDMRFFLIGSDSHALRARYPLPENVEYLGYIANPALATACGDIMLNLSHFGESFGRTVLEAQAGGRPVICYRHGALPELVEAGKTGIMTERGDTAAVAQALLRLAGKPQLVYKMAIAARANARRLLTT